MSVKEEVRMLWGSWFDEWEGLMDVYLGWGYGDWVNEYMEWEGEVIGGLEGIGYGLRYEGMNVGVGYI